MSSESSTSGPQAPRLASLRVPAEASAQGLAANAHLIWRLARQARTSYDTESGNPSEEYRNVCEFMRLYTTLRFYQLALLLGTTGSIITALSSNAVRTSFAGAGFLKFGGLIVSVALLVMEFRASSYWHGLRDRANALAAVLRFVPFPTSSRWNPLTTSGAGMYLHVLVAALWLTSLFVRLYPGA